jgi:hypothetical protein
VETHRAGSPPAFALDVGAAVPLEGADALGEDEAEAEVDVVGLDVLGLALVWPVALLPHAERERALASSAEARTAGRRRRVTVPRFTSVTPASSSDSFCHKNVRKGEGRSALGRKARWPPI